MNLPKSYTPKEYEDEIYKKWEDSGYFNPDNLPNIDKKSPAFTISMPPPNVTGTLHLGHAMMLVYEDLMVRYHRMKGDNTLWVPGTDHAAIATQAKLEKIIKKQENKRKEDLGREEFLKRVREYVDQSKNTIHNQIRKMGASCDWSREKYTLDKDLSHAVNTIFTKMYQDGLIYRGDRIVNWCPRCKSTLADDEVEYKEQKAKLYTFKYSKDFPISIATTRPETKLGDTAVAVHSDDKRYKKYINKEFEVDFIGVLLKIKIIADTEIDPEFGTGALGVTPAHSIVDWQMAEKNNLEIKKTIGQDARILEGFNEFSGLRVKEAREKIVEKIKEAGLLEKEEEIDNNLSICYRCSTPIEPLPSLQWFIDVNKEIPGRGKSLKELSLAVVKNGSIKIIPDRFEKVYYHWMENLRDWCISRQIWWGHRIPVWYKKQKIHVGMEAPEGDGWLQDEDTLDTWFSSALWTFSTLGWPNKTEDLKNFHPTTIMETGYDIIFFWVARMILMTTYALDDIPFKYVYLHGMVRDRKGRKMSKSLDNGIDPIEMIDKYGTDALRLSMTIGTSPGNDIKMYEEKVVGFRNFANKLWNIGRFVQMQEDNVGTGHRPIQPKTLADKWLISRINNLIKEITEDLEKFRFSLAGEKLYNFTWHELADWYLEIAKIQDDTNTYNLLTTTYKTLLKLLHPFTPFVTEKIYEYLGDNKMLMIESWPEIDSKKINPQAEQDFALIQELITAIRSYRKEKNYEAKNIIKIKIASPDKLIEEQKDTINKLARVELERVEKLVEYDFEVGNLIVKIQ